MLTLINVNRMQPPIAPIGLDYIAAAAQNAGIETSILDLCGAAAPDQLLADHFTTHDPLLVGLSFRNVDDCFWPSAQWFVPELARTANNLRSLTDAPLLLGGVGYSIFPEQILEYTGADFGIRSDGEQAVIALYNQLRTDRNYHTVPGLIYRQNDNIHSNPPACNSTLSLPTSRNAIDNVTYFKKGGQIGLETKRGCNRTCIYCAEHLAKGNRLRPRRPAEVADEAQNLLARGIDVLHLCDSEFNIPWEHAKSVCDEFIARRLGDRLRWYAYMTVTPFDAPLARAMKRAGCAGINFTGDSAHPQMLSTYRQPHTADDLAQTVRLCRDHDITVMIDLMLGGPGETPASVAHTIDFVKQIDPHCAGTALGIRIYPHTEIARIARNEGPLETNPNIRRRYEGPVDIFKPTYYISSNLGDKPASLVRDLIGNDPRFFKPMPDISTETPAAASDHNYNDNTQLTQAIAKGARGAYWDILRKADPAG